MKKTGAAGAGGSVEKVPVSGLDAMLAAIKGASKVPAHLQGR